MADTANVVALEAPAAPVAAAPGAVRLTAVTLERAGKTLLRDVSLGLAARGVSAVMGPNGAGKSVLVRLIAGMIAPTDGVVQLDPSVAGGTAVVFQRPVLLRRSVRGNLNHALRAYGVARRARRGRIDELLAMGGLAGLADQPARALSGGEQQRLAITRALAARPRLLLLDEPTASLDPAATQAIEGLIRDIDGSGAKIVLVTHDAGQAKRLADDVVFLHRGQVMEQTAAGPFFARPASAAARAFLAGDLVL